MKPVYIMYSRKKLISYLILVTAIISLLTFALTQPMIKALGLTNTLYGLIIAAAGMIFIYVWHFFSKKPLITIDDSGINITNIQIGIIPWSDVKDACLSSIGGDKLLNVIISNPNHWLTKISPNRLEYISYKKNNDLMELSLDLSGAKTDPDKILALIKGTLAARKIQKTDSDSS